MPELPKTQMQITLIKRPAGIPQAGEHFAVAPSAPMPDAKGGKLAVVRNLFMSLDPGTRAQLDANVSKNYAQPVEIGSVMRGGTIGEVVAAPGDGKLRIGDLVQGGGGWQEYYAAPSRALQRIDPESLHGLPASAVMGVLGGTGLTAYFGLLRVGQPKKGETVLVSTAAGATGSVVAQIAKHVVGCRVVGMSSTPEKCAYLVNELGLDAAINYKAEPDLKKAIRRECPKGVDVYFDNVGGGQLAAAMARMALRGRIVVCGSIAQYNGAQVETVPPRVMSGFVTQRIRMEGFLVSDYFKDARKARSDLAQWIREGKVKNVETVVDGLGNAAAAWQGMFEGKNNGKLTVRIAQPTVSSRL